MTISMYNASVPVFKQMLTGLSTVLGKAKAHIESNSIDTDQLLQARLFPDMFNLIRQVQIACDFAKGISARLAGIDVPSYEDTEITFDELQARISKTLAFIADLTPAQIEGSEEREVVTQAGTPKEKKFSGQSYLLNYGLPHFFFHVTTAYNILRSNGVEIGKRDYISTY
jgi:uncharacterized protein